MLRSAASVSNDINNSNNNYEFELLFLKVSHPFELVLSSLCCLFVSNVLCIFLTRLWEPFWSAQTLLFSNFYPICPLIVSVIRLRGSYWSTYIRMRWNWNRVCEIFINLSSFADPLYVTLNYIIIIIWLGFSKYTVWSSKDWFDLMFNGESCIIKQHIHLSIHSRYPTNSFRNFTYRNRTDYSQPVCFQISR